MKLKIPREHYKFLEEYGKLDEFITVKKREGQAKTVLEKTLE